MDTLFVDIPSESEATIGEAREHLAALAAEMGVPTVEELMAQVDQTVQQKHGPVPATPTWEEVVESWAEAQRQKTMRAAIAQQRELLDALAAALVPEPDVIDAEIVEEPVAIEETVVEKPAPKKTRARKPPTQKAITS